MKPDRRSSRLPAVRSGCAMNMTVYSCGGSCGIDRIPFLAPADKQPGEPRLRKATQWSGSGQCSVDGGAFMAEGCQTDRVHRFATAARQIAGKPAPTPTAEAHLHKLRQPCWSEAYPRWAFDSGRRPWELAGLRWAAKRPQNQTTETHPNADSSPRWRSHGRCGSALGRRPCGRLRNSSGWPGPRY